METQTLACKFMLSVINQPTYLGSANTVTIYLREVIRELIQDESGMVIHRESYSVPPLPHSRICLEPRSLTPQYLSQLLHDQHVPYYQFLGQQISLRVDEELAHDDSLQEPFSVLVFAKFIRERRVVLPTESAASTRGVPREFLQRLVEEQIVDSTELEEEEEEDKTCSICIENFSKSKEIIIRMPRCLHMFHQDCIFEWLGRKNSCPLCRSVPYEEDQETSTQSLA